MILLCFALAGSIGSTWYWWLRVKDLENVIHQTQNELVARGLTIRNYDKLWEGQ